MDETSLELDPNTVSRDPQFETNFEEDRTASEPSENFDEQTQSNIDDIPEDPTTSDRYDIPLVLCSNLLLPPLVLPGNTRSLNWERQPRQPKSTLHFDPATGKLEVRSADYSDEKTMAVPMNKEGFFGCLVEPSVRDKIVIKPGSKFERNVIVETMHISCKCDSYQEEHNYGGVIIYQYDDKSEWRTANGTHCKSGYIAIQDTDSENVKRWMTSEPGVVHGAVYRNVFGESLQTNVVGEGFAIQNGTFKVNSGSLNCPKGSIFHDDRKRMHEITEYCIEKIVNHWKTAGPSWMEKRNFEVKKLLEDFKWYPGPDPTADDAVN